MSLRPEPGYCHPDLEPCRQVLVDWLDSAPADVSWERYGDAPPEAGVVITVRMKWYAEAPFVGERFVYYWWYAFDDLGRMVVSPEVHTQYLPNWCP